MISQSPHRTTSLPISQINTNIYPTGALQLEKTLHCSTYIGKNILEHSIVKKPERKKIKTIN